jgi:arylsulfatase A-like enzyme
MNALVVTFDRLPLRMLGCYGNDWIATPHFDRLAAESVVFDANFTDATTRTRPSVAWWTGRHRLQSSPIQASESSDERPCGLGECLREAGVRTTLLAEACGEESIPLPVDFDESSGPVESFAELVAVAIQTLETCNDDESSTLLWLKLQDVPADWISSRTWNGIGGEADPDSELTEVATLLQQVGEKGFTSITADERTLVRRAYGEYVMSLDESLGRLLEGCHSQGLLDDCLLIVAAGGGDDLGEQADIGQASSQSLPSSLRGEIVQCPLFVRIPNADAGTRRRALVQTIDLAPTICDWFGMANHGFEGQSLLQVVRGETEAVRDHLIIAGDEAAAIRTVDFQLNQEISDDSDEAAWLFVKPDDRWDVLDVADQYPDVVARLSKMLANRVTSD